jgi:hypothetical protein
VTPIQEGEFRLHRMSTKRGRPTIRKSRPLTATERQRRWRKNKTAKAQRIAARIARDEANRRLAEQIRAANPAATEAAELHYRSMEWRRALDWLESLELGRNLADARRVIGDKRFAAWLRREFLDDKVIQSWLARQPANLDAEDDRGAGRAG